MGIILDEDEIFQGCTGTSHDFDKPSQCGLLGLREMQKNAQGHKYRLALIFLYKIHQKLASGTIYLIAGTIYLQLSIFTAQSGGGQRGDKREFWHTPSQKPCPFPPKPTQPSFQRGLAGTRLERGHQQMERLAGSVGAAAPRCQCWPAGQSAALMSDVRSPWQQAWGPAERGRQGGGGAGAEGGA